MGFRDGGYERRVALTNRLRQSCIDGAETVEEIAHEYPETVELQVSMHTGVMTGQAARAST